MARRNANGEGSIYKRKDGRWEGAVYLGTVSGRAKRVRVYGKTRQEVHDKLMAAVAQAQHGTLIPDRVWRVGDYLDYWLEREIRRPLTRRRHETVVRLYLKPGLGQLKLDQLSVAVAQDFLDQLSAEGRSAATIHQVRKVLSAALTYAVRQELLIRNVARLVELPRYKPNEADHWSPEETIQFLRAAQPDPLYPAFVLLALYGLRRGEVLGVRWCDIDFDLGVIRIRQQVQRISGKLRQVELKTESSERDEPLLEIARTVLLAQRETQAIARAVAGDSWQGSGTEKELVFTTKTGNAIESGNLYRSFARICSQHEVRLITLHGMRHTNATTQKNLQVHARDIQAILGHGDIRTTGIYEHVDLKSKRNALEKVEQRLFEPESAYMRVGSRQSLPSKPNFVEQFTSITSGSTDRNRTCDLRLMRPTHTTSQACLTSVDMQCEACRRAFETAHVAVKITVNDSEPQQPTWRDIELPDCSKGKAA